MRVKLKPGEQRRFIGEVLQAMGWTQRELAERCDVAPSTAKGWYHERCLAAYEIFVQLSEWSRVPLPAFEEVMSEEEWRSRRSQSSYDSRINSGKTLGTAEGRSRGGKTSQERRKDDPEAYPGLGAKPIIRAPKSPRLAEFIGIMLGDGGISHYQVTVTLNLWEEKEYAVFVMQLVQKLFGLESTLQERPDHGCCVVVVSSIELVRYLQELGLVQGNKIKLQCGVPEWIFDNFEYVRACLRGLMDTDGCVFHHAYKIRGKEYCYVKATFAVHSPQLMVGFHRLATLLDLSPGKIGKRIPLATERRVRWYYEEGVGTSNPYHWRRYQEAVTETDKRRS